VHASVLLTMTSKSVSPKSVPVKAKVEGGEAERWQEPDGIALTIQQLQTEIHVDARLNGPCLGVNGTHSLYNTAKQSSGRYNVVSAQIMVNSLKISTKFAVSNE